MSIFFVLGEYTRGQYGKKVIYLNLTCDASSNLKGNNHSVNFLQVGMQAWKEFAWENDVGSLFLQFWHMVPRDYQEEVSLLIARFNTMLRWYL